MVVGEAAGKAPTRRELRESSLRAGILRPPQTPGNNR